MWTRWNHIVPALVLEHQCCYYGPMSTNSAITDWCANAAPVVLAAHLTKRHHPPCPSECQCGCEASESPGPSPDSKAPGWGHFGALVAWQVPSMGCTCSLTLSAGLLLSKAKTAAEARAGFPAAASAESRNHTRNMPHCQIAHEFVPVAIETRAVWAA